MIDFKREKMGFMLGDTLFREKTLLIRKLGLGGQTLPKLPETRNISLCSTLYNLAPRSAATMEPKLYKVETLNLSRQSNSKSFIYTKKDTAQIKEKVL